MTCDILLFILQVREGSQADNDFRPTPIPLNEWHEVRDSRSYEEVTSALLETAQTPMSFDADVQKHYWEDALRHSVYLTLVRDKIDELIAKGDVIAPDKKPYTHASSEVDDHDLWEKVKTAPFDEIEKEDYVAQGDVTIMAKGRLMDENGRFRFTEDDLDKEKCMEDKCKKGLKAIWAVKRVRQRDEASPRKYHYELTFSVESQLPKEKRRPHGNVVRTFTVKESSPEKVIEMPQETHKAIPTMHRPQRIVWFHRNISPPFPATNEGRQHKNGLERLFSSLFSDEDDDYVPPRYRKVINPYNPAYGHHGSPHGPPHSPPPHSPYSKVGFVGSPSDQQKRLSYPYKQTTYKYSRPIPPPPYAYGPKPHYLETESVGASFGNPHVTPPENVYSPSGKPILTTKPAFLPTPVASSNKTHEIEKNTQATESATRVSEIVTGKPITRPRPGPIKINYLPDHVRPPVYNAPPGVFVTMDKKPFKPMPPLKIKLKPYKGSRPTDFRPSPQVLDMQQFSEPDPFKETAFRPITWNYQNSTSTTEKIENTENNTTATTVASSTQKINTKSKKPPKKHENIKSQLTTSMPDIITGNANFEEEPADVGWANLINAFSKTTPMASQKDKTNTTDKSNRDSSTTTETSTITRRRTTTTTQAEQVEEETTSTTTSTTVKPKTRTRPPPIFAKPNKVKKHKRITTTTTTQSPTQSEKNKTTLDLTPQASSATATKPTKSTTEKTTAINTTSTAKSTTPATSTTKTTTKPTTTETAKTIEKLDLFFSTSQPKTKNRFRQSTLLQKGTSVNHDKWNSLGITKAPSTLPSIFSTRRKGSNFQGHVTPSSKLIDKKHNLHHEDRNIPLSVQPLSTGAPHHEEQVSGDAVSFGYKKEKFDEPDEDDGADVDDDEEDGVDDDDDEHKEFIFSNSSSLTHSDESSEDNKILEGDYFTTEQIITTQAMQKNLTKCQKKKLLNSSTTDQPTAIALNVDESDNSTDTKIVSEDNSPNGSTSSILEELIHSFTGEDAPSVKNPRLADFDQQESESQSHFVKLDDDLQDFLDSLDKDRTQANDDEYEDDDIDSSLLLDEEDISPIDKWEHKGAPRQRQADADEDYRDRPYGLLELLAME